MKTLIGLLVVLSTSGTTIEGKICEVNKELVKIVSMELQYKGKNKRVFYYIPKDKITFFKETDIITKNIRTSANSSMGRSYNIDDYSCEEKR